MGTDSLDPNAVVVTVGDVKLTNAELGKRMDRLMRAQGMAGMPEDQAAMVREQVRSRVVQAFVAENVLQKEADRLKIAVEPESVREQMDRIRKQIPEGTDMKTVLADMGTTEEELCQSLERDLRVRKLIDQQVPAQPATDEQAEAFYNKSVDQFARPESVHARHILVNCEGQAAEEVRAQKLKLAQDTRQKLVDGADFAKLAGEVSDCPSKAQGGDLGTFPRGSMVKEFEDAAFSQATNAVGPVVTTSFGYHIIQVLDHKQAGTNAFADVKGDIKQYLERQGQQEAAMKYLAGLIEKAGVKYP
jgi:peptidyl-prolyl cis-trans isomerase C